MGLYLKYDSNVLTFRRKWIKTGKFDGVFECSVKRAEHAEKCEMLKCAVSTPEIRCEILVKKKSFIDL